MAVSGNGMPHCLGSHRGHMYGPRISRLWFPLQVRLVGWNWSHARRLCTAGAMLVCSCLTSCYHPTGMITRLHRFETLWLQLNCGCGHYHHMISLVLNVGIPRLCPGTLQSACQAASPAAPAATPTLIGMLHGLPHNVTTFCLYPRPVLLSKMPHTDSCDSDTTPQQGD